MWHCRSIKSFCLSVICDHHYKRLIVPPRKTHFHRHRLCCSDRKCEDLPDYASEGIVMASVDEVLHDLAYLVGYHSNRHSQAAAGDRLPPEGESTETSQIEWNAARC